VILERARPYGLADDRLAHLEEDKPPSLSALTRKPAGTSWSQTVLYELAAEDGVVLMGRGGQWLLRGIPHVLRVRVIAPFELPRPTIDRVLSARAVSGSVPDRLRRWCAETTRKRPGACGTYSMSTSMIPCSNDVMINMGVLPRVRRQPARRSGEASRIRAERDREATRGRSCADVAGRGGPGHLSEDATPPHWVDGRR